MASTDVFCEKCGISVQFSHYDRHLYGHKDEKDLKCSFCQMTFINDFNLQCHLKKHIDAREFVCEEKGCFRSYNSHVDLSRHKVRSHSHRDLRCDQCGISFKGATKLNKHMQLHIVTMAKGSKECPICGETVTNFKLHYRTAHLKLTSFKCHHCSKEFPRRIELNRHIRHVHEKSKPFHCEKPGCTKEFSEKRRLLRHLDTHRSDGPPYCTVCKIEVGDAFKHYAEFHDKLVCTICEKVFTKTRNASDHIKIFHSTERSLFCSICPDKGFVGEQQLRKHMKTHQKYDEGDNGEMKDSSQSIPKSGGGPRKCPICNEVFKNLVSHHKVVHLKIKSPECSVCGKTFATKSGLDRHERIVHTSSGLRNHKCEVDGCTSAFTDRSYLVKHMRIHNKGLNYCQLCKNFYDNIFAHYAIIHADLKFRCDICRKPFVDSKSLETHVESVHEREDKYFCDLCPGNIPGFADKNQVRKHMRYHLIRLKESGSSRLKRFRSFRDKSTKVQPEMIEFDTKDEIIEPESKKNKQSSATVTASRKTRLNTSIKEELPPKEESNEDKMRCKLCKMIFRGKEFFKSHFMAYHIVQYRCERCDEEFPTELELEEHLEAHSDAKVICLQCDDKFIHKRALDRHIKDVHAKQLDFVCSQCDKSFASKDGLDLHVEASHGEISTSKACHICGNTFYKSSYLEKHMLAKHSEQQFQCEICEKKFSFEIARDRHVKAVHLNEKPFNCEYCSKKYASRNDLKYHMNAHHTFDPEETEHFQCDLCDKNLSSAANLKRHRQAIHENLSFKRYSSESCRYCKESFTKPYQMKKHILQVHQNGLKPKRTCEMCSTDFNHFEDFKSHVDGHKDVHICMICGIYYTSSLDLELHKKKHKYIEEELRKFFCDLCPSRFSKKSEMRNHMKTHTKDTNFYVCDICGQSYKYAGPYHYHMKVHKKQKDFVCTFCGKAFILKSEMIIHSRKHTLEKPFKCLICDARFASQPLLKTHLQNHPETRKTYDCKECKMDFFDRKDLRNHEKAFHLESLPFSCSVCYESFKMEHVLRIHMKAKHQHEQPLDYVREVY